MDIGMIIGTVVALVIMAVPLVYYPRKTKQHFENSYFEYDKIRIIKRG